ncbi:hypothetical protein [Hymenobacter lapidiphilus]|uniref:hypothetical protein n=1 Tax=Hymenobacter sp. CCM 8763 TaxID=2303334 RepID=UPI0011C1265C|nr:hypothetical protein [Hymenobacter sp. CCM 8763]
MAYDDALVLERWDTPCSDLGWHLVFEGLIENKSGLVFSVRHEETVYNFHFEQFGPYQIADEAFLEAYQADLSEAASAQRTASPTVGNNFLVTNSNRERSFNLGLMYGIYFMEPLTHYHIATTDSCLDILSATPPTISVRTHD